MVMGEHAEMGGAGRIAQTRTGSLETTGRRVLCLHEEGGLEGKVCTMGQGILGKAGAGGRRRRGGGGGTAALLLLIALMINSTSNSVFEHPLL